jgi:hypothetical protein
MLQQIRLKGIRIILKQLKAYLMPQIARRSSILPICDIIYLNQTFGIPRSKILERHYSDRLEQKQSIFQISMTSIWRFSLEFLQAKEEKILCSAT